MSSRVLILVSYSYLIFLVCLSKHPIQTRNKYNYTLHNFVLPYDNVSRLLTTELVHIELKIWQVLWCRVYFYCWFLLDVISGSHLPLCVTGWLFYALDSCYVTHFSSLRVLEVYVQCANKDIGLETVKPYQTSGFRIWSCKSKNNFTLPASQKKNLSFKLQEFALHTKFWSFTDYLWITDFIPHYKLCAKQVQLKSK